MKLVIPNLGIRARHARMNLFLRAIEVARMRSAGPATAAASAPSVRRLLLRILLPSTSPSAIRIKTIPAHSPCRAGTILIISAGVAMSQEISTFILVIDLAKMRATAEPGCSNTGVPSCNLIDGGILRDHLMNAVAMEQSKSMSW
jgi:hypothetical protein